jgi:hypothetical protein
MINVVFIVIIRGRLSLKFSIAYVMGTCSLVDELFNMMGLFDIRSQWASPVGFVTLTS